MINKIVLDKNNKYNNSFNNNNLFNSNNNHFRIKKYNKLVQLI